MWLICGSRGPGKGGAYFFFWEGEILPDREERDFDIEQEGLRVAPATPDCRRGLRALSRCPPGHLFCHGFCSLSAETRTMSFFVLSTIAMSSFCSCSGTLNLSRTFLKSASIACHSFSVMLRCWCDSFIPRPVYLSGPPDAWQTMDVTWYLRYALGTRSLASLILGLAFRTSSTYSASRNSSPTAAMLYTPPSRSYN